MRETYVVQFDIPNKDDTKNNSATIINLGGPSMEFVRLSSLEASKLYIAINSFKVDKEEN